MRISGVLVVAATLALPSLAGGEVGGPLASARELMEGQEYERALDALTEVIDSGALEPEQLGEAYRRLAECHAALRSPDEATEAYARVLALDPSFYVSSDQSPLVRDPFEAALRASREGERPALRYEPPESLGRGAALVVEPEIVRGSIEGLAAEVTLHLRGPEGLFVTFTGADGTVEVGPEELEGLDEVAFYLVLRDEHGNGVLRQGTPTDPIVVPIGRSSGRGGGGGPSVGGGRPWYEQWWLWTAVGVVVVGLAVGLPLGLTAGAGEGPCERELGAPCDITASIQ